MSRRPSILLISDLSYEAKGRRYCDEDIYLSAQLRRAFDVALAHPEDAVALMDRFDAVLVRNSGPVIGYPETYAVFREHALATEARVFNQLTGKADMVGKQYLPDLWRAGYPVIPTIERIEDAELLPRSESYVIKPKLGADSLGMEFLPALPDALGEDMLLQPRIDFAYEVSFYFVNHTFSYALYAPAPGQYSLSAVGRRPKMACPTRTQSAPSSTAIS